MVVLTSLEYAETLLEEELVTLLFDRVAGSCQVSWQECRSGRIRLNLKTLRFEAMPGGP